MCQDSPFNEIIFATDSCSEDDSLFMKGFDTSSLICSEWQPHRNDMPVRFTSQFEITDYCHWYPSIPPSSDNTPDIQSELSIVFQFQGTEYLYFILRLFHCNFHDADSIFNLLLVGTTTGFIPASIFTI